MSRRVTALAIYILVCLLFVFSSLIEFAYILYNIRCSKTTKKIASISIGPSTEPALPVPNDKSLLEQEQFYLKVDKMMFTLSMSVFVLFNLSYFSYFVSMSF